MGFAFVRCKQRGKLTSSYADRKVGCPFIRIPVRVFPIELTYKGCELLLLCWLFLSMPKFPFFPVVLLGCRLFFLLFQVY